ncbi:BTA121 domain-containing protein surface lipoprotein [Borrelia hispanica]|uniref:BTA121 domain-containing protein surface lipoprotein n=1 Tax=Borrelia hispanica TaxID=40835 RepID=UPI001F15F8C5|nr:hypothetical protein [Borrelia hispanica]
MLIKILVLLLMGLFGSCHLKGLVDISTEEDGEDIKFKIRFKESNGFDQNSNNNEELTNLLVNKFGLSKQQIKAIQHLRRIVIDFDKEDKYTNDEFYQFIDCIKGLELKDLADNILCIINEIEEVIKFIGAVKNDKKKQELYLDFKQLEDDYMSIIRDSYSRPVINRAEIIKIYNLIQKNKFEIFKYQRIRAVDFASTRENKELIRYLKEIIDNAQPAEETAQINKDRHFIRLIFKISESSYLNEEFLTSFSKKISELLKIINSVMLVINNEQDPNKKQEMETTFNEVKEQYESDIVNVYMNPANMNERPDWSQFLGLQERIFLYKNSFNSIITSS